MGVGKSQCNRPCDLRAATRGPAWGRGGAADGVRSPVLRSSSPVPSFRSALEKFLFFRSDPVCSLCNISEVELVISRDSP